MLKKLSIVVLIVLANASAFAQEKTVTIADFAGTWNIEVMSHQVALVIEPQEGNTVSGTMMMMGRDVPLKGELAGRSISFVGVKEVEAHVEAAHAGGASQSGSQRPPANAKPIVVTLLEDGTLSGEMMTSGGPVKWVGEKLKAKKKG
jgi:putative methionine-R-sulfoxide reductase with GAF domain